MTPKGNMVHKDNYLVIEFQYENTLKDISKSFSTDSTCSFSPTLTQVHFIVDYYNNKNRLLVAVLLCPRKGYN